MTEKAIKKLHNPLLSGLQTALEEIFLKGGKSDYVIPFILKTNKKWGSRDRAFVAENGYEIVRNKRLILHSLGLQEIKDAGDIQKMIGAWLISKNYFNDSVYFDGLSSEIILSAMKSVSDPAIKFSVSDDLFQFVEKEIGTDRWLKEIDEMDRPANIYLRTNLRFVSREKLSELLENRGIKTEIVSETKAGLKLLSKGNLIQTEEFKNGFFEIQDAGSQQIVEFLNPEPGKLIIDACAGAGGKSLQLADYTGDKSEIVALDINESKLDILVKRQERNKVLSISTDIIDEAVLKSYEEKADYLLIDAPCSGLGVIKRNPDTKLVLKPDFIENIKKIQQDILVNYSRMLKSGGELVYATCSILPSENSEQIKLFLESNNQFKLIDEKQIWPSEFGYDGFYMAKLKRL